MGNPICCVKPWQPRRTLTCNNEDARVDTASRCLTPPATRCDGLDAWNDRVTDTPDENLIRYTQQQAIPTREHSFISAVELYNICYYYFFFFLEKFDLGKMNSRDFSKDFSNDRVLRFRFFIILYYNLEIVSTILRFLSFFDFWQFDWVVSIDRVVFEWNSITRVRMLRSWLKRCVEACAYNEFIQPAKLFLVSFTIF